jgi:hypothetical protein
VHAQVLTYYFNGPMQLQLLPEEAAAITNSFMQIEIFMVD